MMQMKSRKYFIQSNHGFTLIELLVAMVVALLAMGAIYSTFLNQQKSYVVQQETAAMHQNIRAALFYMEREIRMAGCDPTGNANAGFPIVPTIGAQASSIRFTEDVTGAGGNPDGAVTAANEDIQYNLDASGNLRRTDFNAGGSPGVIVAQNIDAIDFVYLDAASAPIAFPVLDPSAIRSVEITIVARTANNTLASPNNKPYVNQQGTTIFTAPGDNFSRRRLTTSIKCRNLGL
jgi:type IV pilus assembly protein PilW